MIHPLELPSQQRKRFSQNFLSGVFCCLNYPKLNFELFKDKKDILFQSLKALKGFNFERCQNVMRNEFTLKKDGGHLHSSISQATTTLGYKFLEQSKFEFALQDNSFIFSSLEYEGFEIFSQKISEIMTVVLPILGINHVELIDSVGLRKVNTLTINPIKDLVSALELFSESLFATARSGLFSLDGFKTLEEKFVAEKNGTFSNCSAILNKVNESSLTAQLDFDFIYINPISFEEAIKTTLKNLNQFHYDTFLWSVTEKMIRLMEKS